MPPPDFTLLAHEWCQDQSAILLSFVWQAYDQMGRDKPPVDGRDLERSITQLLEPRIRRVMSGDEPFYIQHEPKERAEMKSRGQPAEYDMAFVLWTDERIMWPLEAKVLEAPNKITDYVKAIEEKYIKCGYAPFSSEGAMLGYLLSGNPSDAFANITAKISGVLVDHPSFPLRPHKLSDHVRSVPTGKSYPPKFHCNHLLLEFPGLKRTYS
jgi:hypothetical protein